MKLLLVISFTFLSCGFSAIKTRPLDMEQHTTSSIYDLELPLLDGQMVKLSAYKGKKILIVNTASECGFTPQYESLEALYKKYGDKVVVLGFPANNFGGQEPGTNKEIASFCSVNYGVTFPMFSKISVKGEDMAPIYQWLTQKDKNGWNEDAPTWNFCKYLINEEGDLMAFYASSVEPLGDEITKAISE